MRATDAEPLEHAVAVHRALGAPGTGGSARHRPSASFVTSSSCIASVSTRCARARASELFTVPSPIPRARGDLGGVHLQEVSQDGHLSLPAGERRQRPRDLEMVLARGRLDRCPVGHLMPGSPFRHRPPPAAPRLVQGHGGHPRRQRLQSFSSLGPHPRSHQCLLHRVLRSGVAPGRKGHGVHHARVVARKEPADLGVVQSRFPSRRSLTVTDRRTPRSLDRLSWLRSFSATHRDGVRSGRDAARSFFLFLARSGALRGPPASRPPPSLWSSRPSG